VVVVFPAEMQAGAGYFLGHRADARQIHCTELSRLQDSPDGLRLRPIPRTRDPAWFDRVLRTAADLRGHHPQQHRVWLMDLGPRSAGSAQRRRMLGWLQQRYVLDKRITLGDRWTLTVRRYAPREPEDPSGGQEFEDRD
jgi:hypothetical protein